MDTWHKIRYIFNQITQFSKYIMVSTMRAAYWNHQNFGCPRDDQIHPPGS